MYYYTIQHLTTFHYSDFISESLMEVRMQPQSRDNQACLNFHLRVSPKAKTHSYKDYWGNSIHTFDIPGKHQKLSIAAEGLVSMAPKDPLPAHLGEETWAILDENALDPDFFDLLQPSHFARPSDPLHALAAELGLQRGSDPLNLLCRLNKQIYDTFDYEQNHTAVDSPIEDSLAARKGVCQDFVHIMITLVRGVGIPCRYVSGYLFHRRQDHDRSSQDATHAWLEAWLPPLGWVGFDPTNNLICGERHIKVAVGRDYADVPPTRGVFKGDASSTLEVAVRVHHTDQPPTEEERRPVLILPDHTYHQQQQQQQQ